MGTIAEKLRYLLETKSEIKAAIKSKGVAVSNEATFRDYAQYIKDIESETEVTFQSKTVTPGARNIVVTPDEDYNGLDSVLVYGDANLTAENIADGVTIFGVEGVHEGGGGGVEMPEKYQALFPVAEKLCNNEYANVMIAENDKYITFAFLTDAYAITEYNATTTEIAAYGWYSCNYTKDDGMWEFLNYVSEESPGGNFAKNIRWADCYIEYGSTVLFPVGLSGESGGGGGDSGSGGSPLILTGIHFDGIIAPAGLVGAYTELEG